MISDLKKVPHNWQKVKFAEIAEIVNNRIDNPKESGLQDYIGLEHLDTDEIRIKRYGSTGDVEATKFLCKKGDIIFGKRNSYLRKVAISDRDAVVSAHSMVLRPKGEKIVSKFLPCFMQSSQFWKTAQAISEGSMSPTIKWKTLAYQEFWIPTILDQHRIANILWALEDSLEKTEKLIEITETLKKALSRKLLTKGIGHTKFKKTELGEIPEEWKIVKMKNIVNSYKNGIYKKSSFYGRGVLNIRMFNIKDGMINTDDTPLLDINEEELLDYGLTSGDILINRVNSVELVGKAGILTHEIGPAVFDSMIIRVRVNQLCIPKFLNYFLNSILYVRQIEGKIKHAIGQSSLNQDDLNNILIGLPTVKEQSKIASILSKTDETLRQIKDNLDVKSEFKKRLTNEFLSGRMFDIMRIPQ